jgi:IrrE N-terminal-like domain
MPLGKTASRGADVAADVASETLIMAVISKVLRMKSVTVLATLAENFVDAVPGVAGPDRLAPQRPLASFEAIGSVSLHDWNRLRVAVELDGRTSRVKRGFFRIVEEGLGHGRAGDVHHRRDAEDRFVVRINRNLDPPSKWATLVHELGHVYCGHCGRHDRGWWPDRREIPGLHPTMQADIREFEAEAVAWIIASRAGIETKSVDYLASRVAPLDNERVDLEAILQAANHIESLAPMTALKAFQADDRF